MAVVTPGARIGQPQFADLQSTAPQWPDAEPELSLQEVYQPRAKKKAKAKAGKKAAQRYDARGHRLRPKRRQSKLDKVEPDGLPVEQAAASDEEAKLSQSADDSAEGVEAPQAPRPRVPFAPAPRPRVGPTAPSAMLAMARPDKSWNKRPPEKLEPLKEVQTSTAEVLAQAEVEERQLHFDDIISRAPPSRSASSSALSQGSGSVRGLLRSASGPLSPFRRDIPVPKALHPSSFQRRTRPMDASSALRQLQEKIRHGIGAEESKKVQLEQVALRDLRADLSHMLRRSSLGSKWQLFKEPAPRTVDEVFGSQPVRRRPSDSIRVKLAREASCSALETHLEVDETSRPSSSSSSPSPTFPISPISPTTSVSLLSPVTSVSMTSAKSAMRKGYSRHLREGVSFDSLGRVEDGEQGPPGTSSEPNALMKSTMSRRGMTTGEVSGVSSRGGRSYTLKEMATSESILRARLVDAFNRLADAKELHRDVLPQALGLVGWAMTKEIRRLVDEAYNSLFQYNTMNQNEFMTFFAKFRQLEKQRAKNAFTAFDADRSGSIDFEELGALFESQGIFPLQHVIYELAMEACDGSLVDGLDFNAFQRVLEILREREGFTREERAFFEDVFDKCDGDGSGSLDTLEIGRVLVSLGYSREMKFEEILAEVDIQQKNQLTKQDFLVFMRKIRERDTEHIRNYFRECDTDDEPGLDAREIATLIQSLGYLPDMSCILETLHQLDIDNPEKDLDFEEVWRFLEIYRRQSGLTLAGVAEAKATFQKFSDDVAVGVDMMFQMVHNMGFDLHYHEVRKLMYLVEGNASGVMNEQEFVRAVGHLKDMELRQMWKVVHEEPQSNAARELKNLFESEMCGTDMPKVTLMDFIPWATRVRESQREQVRSQHGFGKEEVESFRQDFQEHSKGNTIRPLDLRRLLTEKFPMMADKRAMKDHRSKLSEILADKGPVKLLEFLALARICHDIIEFDKLKRERDAIQITGFTSAEVDEFRGLFMDHSTDSGLPGSYRNRITFKELKTLLHNVIPLGDGNIQVLKRHLRLVHKHAGDDSVNFVEFLHLMRHLLDVNFAGIAELSKTRTADDGNDLS